VVEPKGRYDPSSPGITSILRAGPHTRLEDAATGRDHEVRGRQPSRREQLAVVGIGDDELADPAPRPAAGRFDAAQLSAFRGKLVVALVTPVIIVAGFVAPLVAVLNQIAGGLPIGI
jgi:hypothetical protein